MHFESGAHVILIVFFATFCSGIYGGLMLPGYLVGVTDYCWFKHLCIFALLHPRFSTLLGLLIP